MPAYLKDLADACDAEANRLDGVEADPTGGNGPPDEAEPHAVSALRSWGLRSVRDHGWLAANALPPRLPTLLTIEGLHGPEPFLPAGVAAMLAGTGGVGKGKILTQLALSVAGGHRWLDTYTPTDPGPVVMVVGEDRAEEMWRRIRSAMDAMRMWSTVAEIQKNLHVMSVSGRDVMFTDRNGAPREAFTTLRDGLKNWPGIAGWRLIILDPASRFLGPDCERDNALATRWIEKIEELTMLPGNPTVVFSHHMNKSGLAGATDAGAARGSSGLTDGVRWQANLDRVTEPDVTDNGNSSQRRVLVKGVVKFSVVKGNYCPETADLNLTRDRDHGGYLRCVPDMTSPAPERIDPRRGGTSSAGRAATGAPDAKSFY